MHVGAKWVCCDVLLQLEPSITSPIFRWEKWGPWMCPRRHASPWKRLSQEMYPPFLTLSLVSLQDSKHESMFSWRRQVNATRYNHLRMILMQNTNSRVGGGRVSFLIATGLLGPVWSREAGTMATRCPSALRGPKRAGGAWELIPELLNKPD